MNKEINNIICKSTMVSDGIAIINCGKTLEFISLDDINQKAIIEIDSDKVVESSMDEETYTRAISAYRRNKEHILDLIARGITNGG